MATLEQQLEWERKHRELGQIKMAAQLEAAKSEGRITDTPLGSGVLRRYLLWLSRKIAKDITTDVDEPGRSKAYSPLLYSLDMDAVALIAITEALKWCAMEEQIQATSLGFSLGKALYGELALATFRDMKADLYEVLTEDLQRKMSKDLRHRMTIFRMQAQKNGIELPEWTPSQKLQVGMYLIGLMSTPNEDGIAILNMSLRQVGRKTKYVVELNESVQDVISSIEGGMISRAGFAAPCLIPPEDWTGEEGVGGFYGDLKIRAVRFFKGTAYQWEVMNQEGHDPRTVLSMLNAHQKVAWKINPFIHDLLKGMRYHGYGIKKKVEFSSAHERLKPERLEWLDTVKEENFTDKQQADFESWKRKMRDWHTEAKRISRVELRCNMAISAAEEVKTLERFYYVYQVDYRGRMYPVSGVLNPQGSDVQKSLLHAADGLPIDTPEALWWFKMGIASKYGIDKLAPDECVKWVDDNHRNIIMAAEDPLNRDAFAWWTDADKPLQFIALCDEYARYVKDPAGFVSRIAVAMDGTCNGLQNYSAMLRDEVGGRATNLISAESGIPNDIYGDVAKAAFKRLGKASPSPLRSAWLNFGFDRSLTKKSVMTQVYGSTFGTCRKSIISYCYDKGIFEGEEYEHSDYAAKLVWDGIGDVVVKAKEAMDWLRKGAGAIMKEGAEYITWLSPTGYRVVQVYNKMATMRVQAHIGRKVFLKVPNPDKAEGPDKMRHRNAFPPNFIHSVDSGHMAFVTVRLAREVPGLFMHFIHDDFGVLPKHAALLSQVIREEFVNMHKGYSLENIRDGYPFLSEPPAKGNLDIECVLTSVNFFR
ncbi:RNA polymerase [Cronobacter phage Dev-CD-23823]|uniref:DNA-directed RNA polymerase n=1 Tax=Cronobacter phage Dev-CD-23823 TaxID=1712539 RepID=A0A0K8IXB5_9CAUD|nr:RNA polymerase [Cronobacter phage Dev-CD-23823]CUH74604.1 Phage RNA polymerase [Cronobacter phage Dev-CD-23823]